MSTGTTPGRRQFLGALALAGLVLGWTPAPARRDRPPVRSCVLVFFSGRPNHLDTFDSKPDAPPRSAAMMPIWIVNDLYVTEDCRRRGVGGSLLCAARDHAARMGTACLTLATVVTNAVLLHVAIFHAIEADSRVAAGVTMTDNSYRMGRGVGGWRCEYD